MARRNFRHTGDLDIDRCVASVHDVGRWIGAHQCQKKRKKGSEWCGVHEPLEATEDSPVIYAVKMTFDCRDQEIEAVRILKETKKQIKLEKRLSHAINYKSTITKGEDGKLIDNLVGRTRGEVVDQLVDLFEKKVRRAEEALKDANEQLAEALALQNKDED